MASIWSVCGAMECWVVRVAQPSRARHAARNAGTLPAPWGGLPAYGTTLSRLAWAPGVGKGVCARAVDLEHGHRPVGMARRQAGVAAGHRSDRGGASAELAAE